MKVLITGVDSSLGSALAEKYFDEGYQVHGIEKNAFHQERGGGYEYLREVIEQVPCPDILINNYGVNRLGWIGGNLEIQMYDIMNVNVTSMYAVVDHLKRIHDAPMRVMNVASASGKNPQRCTSLYCASKAAIIHMTRVMARELAPQGWVVNCIAPGEISDTRMIHETYEQVGQLRNLKPEQAAMATIANNPMGRRTTTTEVAEAIFKINQLPDYINGACIDMAGGA